MQDVMTSPVAVALSLLAILLAFHEIGFRIGRRRETADEDYRRRVDMIRNAVLALVTFLVGFSFAAAGSRYIDRQDMIVKEANAIGTAWLRATLLPEPHRGQLQAELRQYTVDRLEIYGTYDQARLLRLIDKSGTSHGRMWRAGTAGAADDRQLALLVLPPLNDVIDIHSEHLSAARRHIPVVILVVIVVLAAIGMALIGYDNGLVRKRYFLLSGAFAVVSAASLWMTVDLDWPRHGLMQISAVPYQELLNSMK